MIQQQMHINYELPLWGIIVYVLGQLGVFAWLFIGLINTSKSHKEKIAMLEREIEVLKAQNKLDLFALETKHKEDMKNIRADIKEQTHEIRELREAMISMKSVMEMKVLGELKTNSRKNN